MSASRRIMIAVFTWTAACSSPTDPAELGPFKVALASPWAGTDLQVVSSSFRNNESPATATVGTLTLALTRHDDSTLSATLPHSAVGTFDVSLHFEGETFALAPVTLHGFVEFKVLPPEFDVMPVAYAWPRNGTANILGVSYWNAQLKMLDLESESATVVDLGASLANYEFPGPTYQPGVWLIRRNVNGTHPVESWSLGGIPALVSSHPEVPCGATVNLRTAVRLGPATWHCGYGHTVRRLITPPPSERYYDNSFVYRTYFSPRGDRVVHTGYFAPGSQLGPMGPLVAVYQVPSGEAAFDVGLDFVQAADFTPAGDMLVLAGTNGMGARYYGDRLRFVDATTGAVRFDTTLTERIYDVAADPSRPFVYVSVSATDRNPELLVFERGSRKLVARLGVPDRTASCQGCIAGTIAIGRSIFLFAGTFDDPGSKVWRFSAP